MCFTNDRLTHVTLCPRKNSPGAILNIAKDDRYGISSFVYSARRPFHPKRLYETVSAPFCVIQTEFEEEDSDDDGDGDEDEEEDEEDEEMSEDQAKLEALAKMEEQKADLDLPSRAANKRASPVWKGVLRSKGFIWLATRPNVHGEWSQAGVSVSYSILLPPWTWMRAKKTRKVKGDCQHRELEDESVTQGMG